MSLHSLKMLLRRTGFDVRRTRNVPALTFLGLGKIPVQCVLDVGANLGQFARYAREHFAASHIHCFEPLPGPAAQIRDWGAGAGAGAGRVSVYELALGDAPGEAELIEHLDHSPSSSFLKSTERSDQMFPQTVRQTTRRVRVDTLDNWAAAHEALLLRPCLLKLDVQGFEMQVLRGAARTLARVDLCLVEVTPIPLYEGQATFVEIVGALAAAGLHYLGNLEQYHDQAGVPVYMDALFVRPALLG